jgi:hypothetical protein
MLVLVDYVYNKILGAVKVPPSVLTGGDFVDASNVSICWYPRMARLLIAEMTGSTTIKGYSVVPQATRLTKPIPLRSPQTGKTIPVLASLVDDSNFGVGGALVTSSVSGGTAKVVGGSYTDVRGRANVQVNCGETATAIAINCSVTV